VTVVFYIAAAVAVISTIMVITRTRALHALLYLVVSLTAVAVIFYTLGAPFVAALEVIIYAGAIIVLFVFTVMLLNIDPQSERGERARVRPASWAGPVALALVLLVELAWAIGTNGPHVGARAVGPTEVGVSLYGPYAIGVELASTLLLAALIGARHLGQRVRQTGLAPGGQALAIDLAPGGPPVEREGELAAVIGAPGADQGGGPAADHAATVEETLADERAERGPDPGGNGEPAGGAGEAGES